VVPRASEYLGTDIESGDAVDIVADVHRLSDVDLAFALKGPGDYFRLTTDGLAGLFGSRMIASTYEFPARIYSRRAPDTAGAASFLNVILLAEKVAATPPDYV
jgi:hypothetical protein